MKKNINSQPSIFFLKSVTYSVRTFLFLICLVSFSVKAQIDSIKPSLKTKPIIGFKMETKNFISENKLFRLQELKPYFEYNNLIRFGLGYCWLNKDLSGASKSDLLKLNALTFFGAYLINFNYNWSAEIPIDFGFGRIKSITTSSSNSIFLENKGNYSFYEPSFILEYKGFKYFNIGLGTGFRLSINDNSVYQNNLTSQTLIFRFNLKFVEIYNYFLQLRDS